MGSTAKIAKIAKMGMRRVKMTANCDQNESESAVTKDEEKGEWQNDGRGLGPEIADLKFEI